jgi:hypothetical protein
MSFQCDSREISNQIQICNNNNHHRVRTTHTSVAIAADAWHLILKCFCSSIFLFLLEYDISLESLSSKKDIELSIKCRVSLWWLRIIKKWMTGHQRLPTKTIVKYVLGTYSVDLWEFRLKFPKISMERIQWTSTPGNFETNRAISMLSIGPTILHHQESDPRPASQQS